MGICVVVLLSSCLGENQAEMVPKVVDYQGGKFPKAVFPNAAKDSTPPENNTISGCGYCGSPVLLFCFVHCLFTEYCL